MKEAEKKKIFNKMKVLKDKYGFFWMMEKAKELQKELFINQTWFAQKENDGKNKGDDGK